MKNRLLFAAVLAVMVLLTTQTSFAAAGDLIISEYAEGSSLNKYIEVYNGTGAAVDLSTYEVWRISNGGSWPEATIPLSGILNDGQILVVYNPGADPTIAAAGDLSISSGNISHNGDDAIGLVKSGVLIDAVGEDGPDPGSGWDVAGVTNGTVDHTLVRKDTVCAPTTDWDASRGTSAADSEWIVLGNNDWSNIGVHTANCGGGTAGPALVEPFDDASQFTTSEPFFADTFGDFFGLSDGAGGGNFGANPAPPGVKAYTGMTGNFLTGMDLDGEGALLPIMVDWTGIDISGLSTLEFSGDFAEFFDTPGDIDALDYIRITYQIDGGGYQNLLWFSGADFSSTGGPFNGIFREDTDFDGVGDGLQLGNAAQTFTKAIAGSGSSLDLRMAISVNSGDEDFAADNFTVSQAAANPCVGAIAIADVHGPGAATPLAGQSVTIRGVVTADFGGEIVVQENSSAARSGVVVFSSGNGASVGDDVCVTGIASERFDQTQVGGNGNSDATINILSSGNTLPAPAVLPTGSAGAEDWEGVLVRVEMVTVTNPSLGFGEYLVDDGSGGVRVDDLGFGFSPSAGQALDFVQGPLFYTFGDYKIEPRNADDIGVPAEVCGDPVTLIHVIQGNGAASPLDGTPVSIEGIVVGDFQDGAAGTNGDLNGFFVQEEDADADGDPTTSEGIFVFDGSSPAVDVQNGDHVRVGGTVDEFNGLTEITNTGFVAVCTAAAGLPAATAVTLPVASLDELEQVEGMYVTFPQSLTISEFFNYDRFGEIVLTTDRQFQPTAVFDPGTPEAAALADFNALSRITLDDGRTNQNPDPAIHPNGGIFDLTNRFRGGDLVTNTTGVINYAFGLYRIQPTAGADYTPVNPRTAPEPVGGSVQVASFNVLNYFNTIDSGSSICGPNLDQGCRGADNLNERDRQLTKIVSAMIDIDADVLGIIEVENTAGVEAMADIVDGLNAALGAGTYAYIDTGVVGGDAIKVGFLYKPATVSLVGSYAVLDTPAFLDPNNTGSDKNRAALAQTFMDNATGGVFTAAVNHLKSKGSQCGPGDDDPEAGSCNLTRTLAAQILVDWLASDPTGSGDSDILIIGDLNAYDKEDPIDAVLLGADDTAGTGDDYTDLLALYQGEFAYSYVFSGALGYLDYALANDALLGEVTGATAWHANSDEPDILDYDTSFKQAAQDALYEPNGFRSSDHDPVIVGLDTCDEIAPTLSVTMSKDMLWPPNHKYVTVTAEVIAADNFDTNPTVTLLSVTSNEPDNGSGDGNTINDIVIIDDTTFDLRAERSGNGSGRVYTITYQVTDACGNSTIASATVTVPLNKGNK